MATGLGAVERFAAHETNRALLSRGSVVEALLLHEHGLPLHEDTPQDWDGLLAIIHAARRAGAGSRGGTVSAFLPGLARLGFTRLLDVNLRFGEPMRRGPIEHRFGNIECLSLPDSSVGFAASLSVVEHGLDLPRFFAEMARVLLPGGFLFVSTDHWALAWTPPASRPTARLSAPSTPGHRRRRGDRACVRPLAHRAGRPGGFGARGALAADGPPLHLPQPPVPQAARVTPAPRQATKSFSTA